jgi:HNH endonuclease
MAVIIFRQDTRSAKNRPFLWKEIMKGRLRQGWGWHSSFNLHLGRDLLVETIRRHPYTPGSRTSIKEAVQTFEKLERMLDIRAGDLIIVPHQREKGRCATMIATEGPTSELPYRFIGPLKGGDGIPDFRHCIDIEPSSLKEFSRKDARSSSLVDRAIWGRGGYASPVNPVHDDQVARNLIGFVRLSGRAKQEAERPSDEPDFVSRAEGKRVQFYGTRFERDPRLRDRAIEIHGLDCQGCRFNFKKAYGDYGAGFIHVHHRKPLSQSMGPRDVNPKTDLSVLCVNCHSMVHRKRDYTLTLAELRSMLVGQIGRSKALVCTE